MIGAPPFWIFWLLGLALLVALLWLALRIGQAVFLVVRLTGDLRRIERLRILLRRQMDQTITPEQREELEVLAVWLDQVERSQVTPKEKGQASV